MACSRLTMPKWILYLTDTYIPNLWVAPVKFQGGGKIPDRSPVHQISHSAGAPALTTTRSPARIQNYVYPQSTAYLVSDTRLRSSARRPRRVENPQPEPLHYSMQRHHFTNIYQEKKQKTFILVKRYLKSQDCLCHHEVVHSQTLTGPSSAPADHQFRPSVIWYRLKRFGLGFAILQLYQP